MAGQAMMASEEDSSSDIEDKINQQIKFTEEQQKMIRDSAATEVDSLSRDMIGVNNSIDLGELHQKYISFGKSKLEKYQDKTNDVKDLKVTIGQLDDTTSKDVANGLKTLVTNLQKLDPDKVLRAPKNKFLRKIYDPIDAFKKRAMKASSVIDEASRSLQKASEDLTINKSRYEENSKNAMEYARAAREQAEIGREVVKEMQDKIFVMEHNGENPDLVKAWKSEVLAPLEQRVMDLSQIAMNQLQYVTALQILIKSHQRMLDEIYRTEQVALVKFQTAIQVANGIHVQESAREVSNQIRDTSEKLDETNSIMLKESVDSIREASKNMVINLGSTKASLDKLLEINEEFKRGDAENTQALSTMIDGAKSTLDEMQESIRRSDILGEKRDEILGDSHGVNDVDVHGSDGGDSE